MILLSALLISLYLLDLSNYLVLSTSTALCFFNLFISYIDIILYTFLLDPTLFIYLLDYLSSTSLLLTLFTEPSSLWSSEIYFIPSDKSLLELYNDICFLLFSYFTIIIYIFLFSFAFCYDLLLWLSSFHCCSCFYTLLLSGSFLLSLIEHC